MGAAVKLRYTTPDQTTFLVLTVASAMILTMSEIERRRPRSQVAMACTLIRRIGNPIAATTVDVGSGGCPSRETPLAVDEVSASSSRA